MSYYYNSRTGQYGASKQESDDQELGAGSAPESTAKFFETMGAGSPGSKWRGGSAAGGAPASSGAPAAPAAQPAPQNYVAPPPAPASPPTGYTPSTQQQGVNSSLYNTLISRQLNNYSQGKPILDQGYRNAVLGQSQREADRQAQLSSNQVAEQLNSQNLLGSSGYGSALGLIQQQKQRDMLNVNDFLTQQELGQLNNATTQAQGFNSELSKQGQLNLGAQQNYANFYQQQLEQDRKNQLALQTLQQQQQEFNTSQNNYLQQNSQNQRNNLINQLGGGALGLLSAPKSSFIGGLLGDLFGGGSGAAGAGALSDLGDIGALALA